MSRAKTESTPASKTLLSLPADLVSCDAEALRQVFLAALVHTRPIEIDAAEVTRAGTAALQLLVAFARAAEQRQVELRLLAPSTALREALRCTGLNGEPALQALLSG